eukprot:TRINITY_DN40148_c0_g1_i1.p1 TRINITY_DN40148_c0_g1~~TRINITY_DN40148_c0_g1_i1.p1  ORF type:complete len:805 (-),score=145.54 TRINITY_DN40148_c0_g1_i1:129-2483(-)
MDYDRQVHVNESATDFIEDGSKDEGRKSAGSKQKASAQMHTLRESATATTAWLDGFDSPVKKSRFSTWKRKSMTMTQQALDVDVENVKSNAMLPAASHGCGSSFVMKESSRCRKLWSSIVAILLLYTGTIFPYKLAFVEFKIEQDLDVSQDPVWDVVETLVDVLFWIDLFISFFFSFKDDKTSIEVTDLMRIAKRYLRGYFLINFLACVPPAWFKVLFQSDSESGLNKGLRLSRLHRTSRLARLARLGRLMKLAPFLRESSTWQYIQAFRGVRMFNLTVGLFWVVHLMACGWYLCASLHDLPQETWVGTRTVDLAGNNLIDQEAVVQWVHSTYFVLTVFTTVGFGDISATTVGEMTYVNLIMIAGTVVNSIIMSEVITTLTGVDKAQAELNKRCSLIQDFSSHAMLEPRVQLALEKAVKRAANLRAFSGVNSEEMKAFFTGNALPRTLLGHLPAHLFGGSLVNNTFLALPAEMQGIAIPSRLALTIASAVQMRRFEGREVVYQNSDQGVHLFLVLEGTCAFVGEATEDGGRDPVGTAVVNSMMLPTIKGKHGKRAVDGAAPVQARKSVNTAMDEDFQDRQPLFPYMLFGHGSYFGDFETLTRNSTRQGYARVESEHGATLLLLHKNDLLDFRDEYHLFWTAWVKTARRKEISRQRLLLGLTKTRSYRRLAVETIQAWVREYLSKPRSRTSSSGAQQDTLHEKATEDVSRLDTSVPGSMMDSDVEEFKPSAALTKSPPLPDTSPRQLMFGRSNLEARVEAMDEKIDQIQQTLARLIQAFRHQGCS